MYLHAEVCKIKENGVEKTLPPKELVMYFLVEKYIGITFVFCEWARTQIDNTLPLY